MTTQKSEADAKTIAAFQSALEDVAQAIRSGEFSLAAIQALDTATNAYAERRADDLSTVTGLLDEARVAMQDQDATGAREALDALAEHFGTSIDAPPPAGPGDGTAVLKLGGATVRLSASEIAACKQEGARLRSFAANKAIRSRAQAAPGRGTSGVGETVWLNSEQPVRLSPTEVAACRAEGADPQAYARNKLIRVNAMGERLTATGQIERRTGRRS